MTTTREVRLVPEAFGPLQGVRILSTGVLIAELFAAAFEVIQVERPGEGDIVWRSLGMKLPTKNGKGEVGAGVGVLAKSSATPGKIWRGSVPLGHDNERVYGKVLGLGRAEIAALRESGVV